MGCEVSKNKTYLKPLVFEFWLLKKLESLPTQMQVYFFSPQHFIGYFKTCIIFNIHGI